MGPVNVLPPGMCHVIKVKGERTEAIHNGGSTYRWGCHHKMPDADRSKQQSSTFLEHSIWACKVRLSAGLGPPEAPFLGLQKAMFVLCPEVAISIRPRATGTGGSFVSCWVCCWWSFNVIVVCVAVTVCGAKNLT